ncbi:MAG TPA: hypothetical protein VKV40_17600 [Ktedonobacteraceae bacterium]|nr:hypothetical protein [Ktedonobacteraceae bacterium]
MQEQEQEQVQQEIQEEIAQEISPRQQILVMRNIMDNQLETCDDIEIGRVADIEAELLPDGRLVLTKLLTGPESLAGRVSSRLRPIVHFFLRHRFEHSIPIDEVDGFHPTLRLRGRARDYTIGASERWIANHILRWIPGSGWKEWHERLEQQQPGPCKPETEAEVQAETGNETQEIRAPGDAVGTNTSVASTTAHQPHDHTH